MSRKMSPSARSRVGDELPEAMRDRCGRLERLKRCRERLEAEAAAAGAEYARKLQERAAQEAETVNGGRKTSAPGG